ncbi:MAG: TIGR00366 family protein, partial [Bacteroidota bacterium]
MKLAQAITHIFGRYLPSPFTIAVLLTFLTLLLAWGLTDNQSEGNHLAALLAYWENGIWDSGLLVFAYQMMLILVLGHVLVLSPPVETLVRKLTEYVTNSANAALFVVLPTLLVSYFNWGLGLIFGAILARKVGEHAQTHSIPINYPLIGACGYAGLMVWHGGISGSAPIKVSEEGHLQALMAGMPNSEVLTHLPDTIPTSETIFSQGNLLVFLAVVLVLSFLAFRLGKTTKPLLPKLTVYRFIRENSATEGAERLDSSRVLAVVFG